MTTQNKTHLGERLDTELERVRLERQARYIKSQEGLARISDSFRAIQEAAREAADEMQRRKCRVRWFFEDSPQDSSKLAVNVSRDAFPRDRALTSQLTLIGALSDGLEPEIRCSVHGEGSKHWRQKYEIAPMSPEHCAASARQIIEDWLVSFAVDIAEGS